MSKISQEERGGNLGVILDYEIRGSSKFSPVRLLPVKWAAMWYLHKAKVKSIRWAKSVAESEKK